MYTETNLQQPEQHLFGEELLNYRETSVGQRFFNYLIDLIPFYGLLFLTGFVLAAVSMALSSDLANEWFSDEESSGFVLFAYLLTFINFLGYYTCCEKIFKGRTLGKLITGTRAVREDGKELTWKDAFLRSLSRLVPFEPFSAFGGYPWHDKWTKTMVVKTR